jgi:sugar (pentulose or hexulose) kinase
MEPVAQDKVLYLQGLLEGIARIEKKGYDLLEQLGADKITSVRSSGGGSESPAFTRIRERIVERPFIPSVHVDAAYGSALLAMGKI